MNREDPFLDEGLRPDIREEFVLRDQMTRVPHQRDEDVKGFRREPDDSGAAQQLALGYVECAIAEMKRFAARHQLSANLSKTFGTTRLPRGMHVNVEASGCCSLNGPLFRSPSRVAAGASSFKACRHRARR